MKTKTNFLMKPLHHVNDAITGFILRLTIAVVIWPHGAQMALGIFGGNGYQATMQYFTENMELPWILSFLVVMIQFVGSLFILVGWFTRVNALMMLVITLGMIVTSHWSFGFFMNWYGNQAGEGYEYHLLLLGLCLALVWGGAGRFSLDENRLKRLK